MVLLELQGELSLVVSAATLSAEKCTRSRPDEDPIQCFASRANDNLGERGGNVLVPSVHTPYGVECNGTGSA